MVLDTLQIATIFKALCDANRVSIIQHLQNGEQCACHLSDDLGLAQSKLSYHMKILCDSGLVDSWSVGKWTHYRISPSGRETALSVLSALTTTAQIEGESV